MKKSDHEKVRTLLEVIKRHPLKYYAWEAVLQLKDFDTSNFQDEFVDCLKFSDQFSRECFLEVLVMNEYSNVLEELSSIFQHGKSELTTQVSSLLRLRAKAELPLDFYKKIDANVIKNKRRVLSNPLELINAIPNIIFPEEKKDYAIELINSIYKNPEFFDRLTEKDMKLIHSMFYSNNLEDSKYRTERLWDFGASSSPIEPYDQTFIGPAVIPYVMDSFLKKMRYHKIELISGKHPIQFIGESFFYQNIIHPNYDCNGRSNFLLMNLFLLHSKLPYINLSYEDLPEYYKVLNLKAPTKFVEFLGNMIQRN